jgi:hypothetical protein
LFSAGKRNLLLLASLLFTLLLQWYVLNYLPLVDCLPFKRGNNIEAQTRPPAGSIPDSIAIRFIYEKEGKRYEFAPESLPADFETYTYVDRIDKVVRQGNAVPPIKGFTLKGVTGIDSAAAVYAMPKVVLLFVMNIDNLASVEAERIRSIQQKLPVFIVTSSTLLVAQKVLSEQGLATIPVCNNDNTVVKTAARTDPTMYYLEKGTVINKWGKQSFNKAVTYIKQR